MKADAEAHPRELQAEGRKLLLGLHIDMQSRFSLTRSLRYSLLNAGVALRHAKPERPFKAHR